LSYILFITYTSLFLYAIWGLKVFKNSGLSPIFLTVAFLTKLVFAALFYWVYTHYYSDRSTADLFKYFDDGKIMFSAFYHHPLDYVKMIFALDFDTEYYHQSYYVHMNHWYREWELTMYNDNRTMIRINALFHVFSMGNVHIHNLFGCFLSFLGLTLIYNTLKEDVVYKKTFAILVFFLPSTLFWSSALLKESLLILVLGILISSWNKLTKKQWGWLIPWVLCIWILFFLKTYMVLFVLPFLLAQLVQKSLFPKGYVLVVVVLFLTSLVSKWDKKHDVYYNIYKKQEDFLGLASHQKSGSLMKVEKLKDWSVLTLLKSTPQALKTAFILKWPWEKASALEWVSMLENYILLIMTCLALMHLKQTPIQSLNWFWFSVFFTLSLFLLIGWTTPVLGAVVRYRVPLLPFWMMILTSIPGSFFQTFEFSKLTSWINLKPS
jgi:hypothetical protein